jgi:hypothetical protein
MRLTRQHLFPSAIPVAVLLVFLDVSWLDTYRYPIASPDFFVYYLAAQIGVAHGWAAMYDPTVFLPAVTSVVHRPLPYLNPPELAWLILPLSLLPYSVAAWIWRGILAIAFSLTCLLAAPGSRASRIVHGVSAALLLPLLISAFFGQVSLLITAALALAWWLLRQDRHWLAGIALAAISLKPQAAFLVPLALLVAGYGRVFLSWLGATAILAGVGFLAVGTSVFHNISESMALVHGIPGPVQISLERQLALPIAVVAIAAVVSASAIILIRLRGQGPSIPMAAALLVSTLVSPYINFYDLSAVLLAGWLILAVHPPRWQTLLTIAMYVPLYLAPVWPLLTAICLSGWLLSLTFLHKSAEGSNAKLELAA